MTRRYFEDLSLGERWTSRVIEITEQDIIDYARKFDPQPMHIDPEAAARGPNGSVIASGWMIAALTLTVFIEAGGYGETPVLGLGVDELRWARAVKPGDRLVVEREVIELRRSRSNPRKGVVRTKITVTNQRGEVALSMIASGMIDARSDGQGAA